MATVLRERDNVCVCVCVCVWVSVSEIMRQSDRDRQTDKDEDREARMGAVSLGCRQHWEPGWNLRNPRATSVAAGTVLSPSPRSLTVCPHGWQTWSQRCPKCTPHDTFLTCLRHLSRLSFDVPCDSCCAEGPGNTLSCLQTGPEMDLSEMASRDA